jgi:hypothetical protein
MTFRRSKALPVYRYMSFCIMWPMPTNQKRLLVTTISTNNETGSFSRNSDQANEIGVRFIADAKDYHPQCRLQTGALVRPFFPPGQSGVKPITHLHPPSKLIISGTTPPLPEMSSRHTDNSIFERKMWSSHCICLRGVRRGGSRVPFSYLRL